MASIPTSKAEAASQALSVGQAALSPALPQFLKYQNMYNDMVSLVDKVQKVRSVSTKAILLGAIKDTGNPVGTAVNLVLNAKTVVDKGITKKVVTEYSKKALGVLI
jgi:hypothetical protein